ncbi:MAG TPA: S41 family peptidase [Pyrinomonadaceae bacterium]|nr:S41 family peptidase [Pyrinomonadaceae bacterium]
MKNRSIAALATLLALALLIPTFVLAQQQQQQEAPPDRQNDMGSVRPGAPTAEPRARPPRPNLSALEGVELDFAEALTMIQENYVDGDKLDYNDVFKSSIIGMLRTLDPHSNFYDAKEYEEQRADWRAEYYGIGASISDYQIGERTDTYILSTFEGAPAHRAGLRFGDRIVEVDGQSVVGKRMGEVRDKLLGPRGTAVKVTVERAGTNNRETFDITRDAVSRPSVPDAYMLRPGVGYVDMTRQFNADTADKFQEALESLRAKGMNSLVLDLRNNPGGLLDQAVKVSEKFLQRDLVIVSQKGRGTRGTDRPVRSTNSTPSDIPLVVLVNRNSASASEIVAGAMQDHDRAIIVGETTFGKGLVQSITPLEYGTALLLTTTKYLTPSGRLIQRDYSNTGYYDYIMRGLNQRGDEDGDEGAAAPPSPTPQPAKPAGPESFTDSGRTVYGGGGIAPDEAVRPRLISPAQQRIIDPVFAFARELANGRVSGFDAYKVQRPVDYAHDLTPADFPMTDALFKAFKDFVAARKEYKLTAAQLDRQRDFILRQLRYDLATAAYGTVKAQQVLVADDPQVARGIEALPRARELAAAASQGRNPPQKSYDE